MFNDDGMDRLLRNAMSAKVPELSPAFDTAVMRRVQPRRLTRIGRVVMTMYVVLAAATAAWLIRDLPWQAIGLAIAIGAPVAIGASAYARYLASATRRGVEFS